MRVEDVALGAFAQRELRRLFEVCPVPRRPGLFVNNRLAVPMGRYRTGSNTVEVAGRLRELFVSLGEADALAVVVEVVRHEYAHAVCWWEYRDTSHGPVWVELAAVLGFVAAAESSVGERVAAVRGAAA